MCTNIEVAFYNLLSYFSDFNFMEEFFSFLKKWIKKNRFLVENLSLSSWKKYFYLTLK